MLLQQFLTSAERHAEKTALYTQGGETSYGALHSRTLAFSAWLAPRIAPGDRIALLLENSADYISCCYGAWAAGAVVVALNTALKDEDITALLRHAGATHLVADHSARSLRQKLTEQDAICVLVAGSISHASEVALASLPSAPTLPQSRNSHAQGLACIIYTSGTTGNPKGVMLSHHNLAVNVEAIRDCLAISESDRALCLLPFYYSFGNSVLHTHLSCGASLILEQSLMYPHRILEAMQRWRADAFYGVPSTYYLLLARTQIDQATLPPLRYCAQAGGPMSTTKISQWQVRLPDTPFVVMYGQTEATARLTWLPPERLADKPGSVGIAVAGVELSIRDTDNRPLPADKQGEVCARGDNVMLGYWANDSATAEVLRDGWLHTGDIGYQDREGYLYLTGRSKEMIKTGAHRISPREIEEVIAELTAVDDVAVIGAEDPIMGQVIKACIISGSAGPTLQRQIKHHCRQRLALYKVPKSIAFLDDFPRTASGKIKKHLLQ